RASLATGDFPRALLEGCPTPGQWCDEGVLCLNSGDGGNACVALCRFAAGDDDCAGTTCTADILTSEEIGLCLP
ncbi:MAG: hypothetical protein KC635_24710, partial [Myxococcales bacterium]|nr:hypothetical protein [Myxococcales bacterium]